jgi:hypothetical protein
MAPLAIWLLAVGIADCVSSFSGRISCLRRAVIGSACGGAAVLGLAELLGYGWAAVVVMTVTYLAGVTAWSLARTGTNWAAKRPVAGLVYFTLVTLVIAGSVEAWPKPSPHVFSHWLAQLPYGNLHRGYATVLMVAGAFVFFLATGNALVRLVLTALQDSIEPIDQPLRGGRVIGALERALIFSIALAGDPTAVALVISAKSLLRFPEITRTDKGIDTVTEYFLVGSLTSWVLALALVPLVHV